MSRRVRTRLLSVLGMACVFAAVVAGQDDPTPERLKDAERVFRDVYGKEYDRVSKNKSAADKAALAKRLWDAARGSAGDPALVRVLGDKALALALADPAGLPVALDIKRSRVTDGKERPEQLAAVAAVIDKVARAETPEKRAALALEAVELYREAAELENAQGTAAQVASYLTRAKAVAQTFLPPAQALPVTKDIAAYQTELDATRRHIAEVNKLADVLKAKPDDPKANQGMALAMLRAGRTADAARHVFFAPSPKLRAIRDALAARPPNPAAAGNAFREAADEFPTERAALLGLARQQYESALAADPKHPDANRMRLLAKELPAFKPVGPRPPAGVVELIDENPAVADWFAKDKVGAAKVEWATDGALLGRGCLRVAAVKPDTTAVRTVRDDTVWNHLILEAPGPGEYRYVTFSYRQTGGTRFSLRFHHFSAGHVQAYVAGPVSGTEKAFVLAEKPSAEWVTVTRDLFADHAVATPTRICGVAVETDGEAFLDGVYLSRTARDLKRTYAVLGATRSDAKP